MGYSIIIFEVLASDKKFGLGLFCTEQPPHLYVYNKCRDWIEKGFNSRNINMIYSNKTNKIYDIPSKKYAYHLEEGLFTYKKESYKSKGRLFVLENFLKYSFIQTKYETMYDVENYAVKILKKCCECKLGNIEKFNYVKPKNKWISEELLYKTIKKIYNKYNVIYQYRPPFLKSDIGGQLSYDIFIEKLRIAIEYQGAQHFKPVEYFGGEKAFIQTKKRDTQKKILSKKNGIKLIYINYWENITTDLIKEKIGNLQKFTQTP